MFLANYADVLTDAPLDRMVERFTDSGAVASLLAVAPQAVFHIVDVDGADRVNSVSTRATDMGVRVNGGYFVLRPEVIDHIPEGGDLVGDACMRPREGGPPAVLPLRRLLAARGHAQGAQRARGRLPGRHASLDALGAPGRERTPLESLVEAELVARAPSGATAAALRPPA